MDTVRSKYNTNLASEFYVLSMLYRVGAEASLTLGNKKSVDIVVVHAAGDTITVDVKGLVGKTGWPIDNFRPKDRHFVAFLSFLDGIDNPSLVPEVYIVPASDMHLITYSAPGGRKVVQYHKLSKGGKKYLNAWAQLLK